MPRKKLSCQVVPAKAYTMYCASGKAVCRHQRKPFKPGWVEQIVGGAVRLVPVPGERGMVFLVTANEQGKEPNPFFCQFYGTVIKADRLLVSVAFVEDALQQLQL